MSIVLEGGGSQYMEVRGKNGKGPLLFEWYPDTKTIDLIHKDMYYKVQLDEHAYCVCEERSKYECKQFNISKKKN